MAASTLDREDFKDTELGLIPETWSVVTIKELANVKYGKARPQSHGSVPAIGSGGIYAWVNESLVEFPTIVVGRKGTAGKAWLHKEPCWPSDTTFYLDWTSEVDIDFLYSYLRLNPLSGEHAKTTLPSLQKPDLEDYKLPFPPLAEQKRISHVLRIVQDSIDTQDRLIVAARELRRSLTHRLFGYGPFPEKYAIKESAIGEIPEHWEVVRLKDVSEKPMYGYTESATNKKVGPKFLRITDITDDGVNWATVPYCHCNDACYAKYRIETGDILFARTGATTGKSYLIRACPEAVFASYLIRVRAREGVTPEYLSAYFQTGMYWDQIYRGKSGAAQPGVNASKLWNLLVLLPPDDEQKMISGLLSAAEDRISQAIRQKSALEAFFESMLYSVLTGRTRIAESEVIS